MKKLTLPVFAVLVLAISVLLVGTAARLLNQDSPRLTVDLPVESWALNDYGSDFDGQWQGITVASDGNSTRVSPLGARNGGDQYTLVDRRPSQATD